MGVFLDAKERVAAIERCLKEQLKDSDAHKLDATELHILIALYDFDGQRVGDVAHKVGVAATSFTPLLDKLERIKMIERKHSTLDRRVIHICLTDSSRNLRSVILAAWQHCEREFGGVDV